MLIVSLVFLTLIFVFAYNNSKAITEYSFEQISSFELTDIISIMLIQGDGSVLYSNKSTDIIELNNLLLGKTYSLVTDDINEYALNSSLHIELNMVNYNEIIKIAISDELISINDRLYNIINVANSKVVSSFFLKMFNERFNLNEESSVSNLSEVLLINPESLSKIEAMNYLNGDVKVFESNEQIQNLLDLLNNLAIIQLNESPLNDNNWSEVSQNCIVLKFYLSNPSHIFYPYLVLDDDWITVGGGFWYKVINENYDISTLINQ